MPAGSCVFTHSAIWHRAKPNLPDGSVRRVLLLMYIPTWMRRTIHEGTPPPNGPATRLLEESSDPETRELLGGLISLY
ncbi:MAG TPA: hypothetical protein VGJ84_15315 [Polyangiaceae bacterium]